MINRILSFLLIMAAVSFNLYAEDQIPQIFDIALIKSEIYDNSMPPAIIPIGIEMGEDAFYKLSDKNNVIRGGLFHRGLNILYLEASRFFEKSESHVYFLELKKGNFLLRKEIQINIKLESEEKEVEPTERGVNPEYKLSMFVGDELIISSQKVIPRKIPLKVDLPPWPEEYKPFGPVDTSEFTFNSFSILNAIGVLQGLLKNLGKAKENEPQVKPIPRLKQITTTFVRIDSEGKARKVEAVITLRTKD